MTTITVEQALSLAQSHHQAGRLGEAEVFYRQVLQQRPDDADVMNRLGALYGQAGRNDAALELLARAVAVAPSASVCHFNLGLVLAKLGRIDEAIAAYRNALQLQPSYVAALLNLGNALCSQRQFDEGIMCFSAAISFRPDISNIYQMIGEALKANGSLKRAAEFCAQAPEAEQDPALPWSVLAAALSNEGRWDESAAAYLQALAIHPEDGALHHDLANAFQNRRLMDKAIATFKHAVELSPNHAGFHNSLGYAHILLFHWDQAIQCFRKAVALDPNLAMAHNNLANILKEVGLQDEAIAHYEKALALEANAGQHSNLIYQMHYSPEYDAQSILREQERWSQIYAQPLEARIKPHENDASPERRLRIGYVSYDFRNHAAGKNILPLIQNHDHASFEIFCYANMLIVDELTEKFRSSADRWENIANIPDENVADLIRRNGIDILVDLSVHSAGNRLPLFALKSAPIQVTFCGYPGGTGLKTMDYRLSDPYLDPPEFDSHYSEKTIRLRDSFWCYDPASMGAAQAPPVNALPVLRNGFITFGCLNNFCKVNDSVVALWSRVLKAVGGSRLLLMAHAGETRARLASQFEENGINIARVQMVDRRDLLSYFELYHQIDIGLDTFPYNGHTTSLDSYWMGVPVVTLKGNTAVGRAGWSQLSNLGLAELAAESPEKYVNIAVELARDLPKLAEIRANLRQRLLQSPLVDSKRFTRNIESAYRQIWRQWCQSKEPSR